MRYIEYHWTYQPPNFFEVIPTIANGRFDGQHIYVRIDEPMSDALKNRIEHGINARFLAQQAERFKPYMLTFVGHQEIGDNGQVEKNFHMARGHLKIGGFELHADVQFIEPDGTVSYDSKAERHARIQKLGDQLTRHAGDPTSRKMLASKTAAVEDPKDELVHLFEVLEALETRFGDRDAVRRELALTKTDIKPLAELANNPDIAQGRHRGQQSTLRDATKDELTAARAVAEKLVRAYLDYLDRSAGSPQ